MHADSLQTALQWGRVGTVAMEAAGALVCASSERQCCSQPARWRWGAASPGRWRHDAASPVVRWSVIGGCRCCDEASSK